MKVVIPGGSGQVGTLLARAFHGDGHEVVVLSRGASPAPWRTVAWDARTPGPWAGEVDGADVVINLAGHNVSCRYDAANRREIMRSRIDSTRAAGQASTATLYAHTYGAANDEATGRRAGRSGPVALQHRRRAGVGGRAGRGEPARHAPRRCARRW
jgi:nucleoside-diphosphate-sugar epimerase